MREGEETKVCPLCAESIRAAAKVCPHCRHWLKKWSLLNPNVAMPLYAVVFLTLICLMGVFIENMFGPKRQFAEHQKEVFVTGSEFSHRTSGSNSYVTVVGRLTNSSDVGWKSVMVEAQFFDKAGRLIDAIPAEVDYRGVTVLPHGIAAFKIETKAATTESNYATHKAFVRSARDIDALGF